MDPLSNREQLCLRMDLSVDEEKSQVSLALAGSAQKWSAGIEHQWKTAALLETLPRASAMETLLTL
jgi:hypothetical protein